MPHQLHHQQDSDKDFLESHDTSQVVTSLPKVHQNLPMIPREFSSLFIPAFLDKMCRKQLSSSSTLCHFLLMLVIVLHTLCLLSSPVNASLSKSQVKRKLRKNSPIYYIQTPYNFLNSNPFLSGLSTYSSLSSSLLTNRHISRPLISSTLYQLPTKYLSNGKPVDVVSKKTSKKKGESCHVWM